MVGFVLGAIFLTLVYMIGPQLVAGFIALEYSILAILIGVGVIILLNVVADVIKANTCSEPKIAGLIWQALFGFALPEYVSGKP